MLRLPPCLGPGDPDGKPSTGAKAIFRQVKDMSDISANAANPAPLPTSPLKVGGDAAANTSFQNPPTFRGEGGAQRRLSASWSPRLALAALSLSMLMPSLDTSIANVGLPALATAFAAPFQAVQWVVLAYLLAITCLIVSAGRLGDLLGRRRLLLAGIVIFTLSSLGCGLAPSLPTLIIARAAQGLGAAIMMSLTIALVSGTVAKERTGRAMGLLGTMSAIGTSLGPSLGGLLIAYLDWRLIFLVNVPIGIINWGLAYVSLPRDPRPEATGKPRPRFDPLGTCVLALTLGAYALAMTLGESAFGTLNAGLLMAAIIGALLFLAVERRVAAPLLRLSLFARDGLSQGGLALGLALSVIVSAALMATLVVGPFYLGHGLGLAAGEVGLVMSAGPLVSAFSGVPGGRLVDRFGARRMMLQGLGGIVLGLGGLAFAPMLFGVAGYVGAIMLTTSHYALFQAANNTGIMRGIGPDERGLVSGMLSLSRNLGLVTGAAVLGAVFAYGAGGVVTAGADPAAIAHGLRLTFALAGGAILLGLIAALRR